MWLVLSISTDSLTIRILLAYVYDITIVDYIVPKNSPFKGCRVFRLYVAKLLLYNNYV